MAILLHPQEAKQDLCNQVTIIAAGLFLTQSPSLVQQRNKNVTSWKVGSELLFALLIPKQGHLCLGYSLVFFPVLLCASSDISMLT